MSGFVSEFKEFISQGNVMDMAVGIIIGTAFTAIVTSLVNDIIMPIIGLIIGGIDFSGLAVTIGGASLTYGNFISAVINFLLIALVIFIMIKSLNKAQSLTGHAKTEAVARTCPFCKETIDDDATRCPHCTSELPAEA